MIATQIEFENLNDKSKDFYLSKLEASHTDILLLSVCEFFYTGKERENKLNKLSEMISFFTENGFDLVVWTNSLGYGVERDNYFQERFGSSPRLTSFEGNTSTAVCTLDEKFSDAMCENLRDFIKAGARTILWDDDLVQSVRPGAFCTCEKHMKLFAEKTGRYCSRDEIRDFFTGSPTEERSAFLDIMGESMLSFARKLRSAADAEDPSVRMGLCASYTHYDIEGVEITELLEILAGKGNKPLFRLSGAPYWSVFAQRFPGQSLGAVCEFVKMQAGWFDTDYCTLLDENDPFPRDSRVVPESYCELYDKISMTLPSLVRNKYFLCADPENGDFSYYEAHTRNVKHDETIEKVFHRTTPYGFNVIQSMHTIKDAVLPAVYPGNGPVMSMFSQPYAGIFASLNCMPVKYSKCGPSVVFGETARSLTYEEIKNGLVLDFKAALILKEKGFDVGFGEWKLVEKIKREIFSGSVNEFSEPYGEFYDLTTDENVIVKSAFTDGEKPFPACYFYQNKDGFRFAVYSFDASSLTYGLTGGTPGALFSKERYAQLNDVYNYIYGERIITAESYHPWLHVSVSADTKRKEFAVLLCNISADTVFDLSLTVRDAEILIADGEWTAHKGKIICSKLPAYEYTCVRIKIK